MCLWTKNWVNEPSVSDKGIKCYKVIKLGEKHFLTPVQGTRIADKVVNGDRPFKATCQNIPWRNLVRLDMYTNQYVYLEHGYIHAYHRLSSAKKFCKDFERCYKKTPKLLIYRCEIPADTEYFDGRHGDICARQIVFKECVYKNF